MVQAGETRLHNGTFNNQDPIEIALGPYKERLYMPSVLEREIEYGLLHAKRQAGIFPAVAFINITVPHGSCGPLRRRQKLPPLRHLAKDLSLNPETRRV